MPKDYLNSSKKKDYQIHQVITTSPDSNGGTEIGYVFLSVINLIPGVAAMGNTSDSAHLTPDGTLTALLGVKSIIINQFWILTRCLHYPSKEEKRMDKEEPGERRKHKRFKAQDGAFAAPRGHVRKLWQIIDISRGGLAFRYIPSEEDLKGSSELDLMTRNTCFSLEKLPYKIVSDDKITNEHPASKLNVIRRGVQFGKLAHDQRSQLEYFIRNYTLGEV